MTKKKMVQMLQVLGPKSCRPRSQCFFREMIKDVGVDSCVRLIEQMVNSKVLHGVYDELFPKGNNEPVQTDYIGMIHREGDTVRMTVKPGVFERLVVDQAFAVHMIPDVDGMVKEIVKRLNSEVKKKGKWLVQSLAIHIDARCYMLEGHVVVLWGGKPL